ncbi:MAG TPA: hypothetical protein P5232_02615 [Candidatus Moranbacteria bacterium]|nr:hypothetical protein [Candidatus Moranbacteria bacterium]
MDDNKKIWPTLFSWGYFLLSLIISSFVPEVGQAFSNFTIIKKFREAYAFDYRATLMIFGSLIFIFALMYLIDFLRKKYLNYSPPPDTTEKQLKSGLYSFWLILEMWRIYAVIIGTIILIASLFKLNMSSLLEHLKFELFIDKL